MPAPDGTVAADGVTVASDWPAGSGMLRAHRSTVLRVPARLARTASGAASAASVATYVADLRRRVAALEARPGMADPGDRPPAGEENRA